MILVHTLFLVFTSIATILQILNKRKYTLFLENEKEKNVKLLRAVVVELNNTSNNIITLPDGLSESVEETKVTIEYNKII
jgi:hypothetical protein